MRGLELFSRLRESRPVAAARDRVERHRRVPWPEVDGGGGVAVVVVNHNTRELIAQLVFSLYRVLGADQLARVVVVDNASTDGSLEVLRALDAAGLIHLIANDPQRYHGSGLNQGISWLAEHEPHLDHVWVLDSDTVVLRRDALTDQLAAMQGAAVLGESFGVRDGFDHLALCTLLLDPRQAWRPPVAPFQDDGTPEHDLLKTATAAGLGVLAFPVLHGSYVLHLGSATQAQVAAMGERRNRYYTWARRHHTAGRWDYTRHPLGAHLHGQFRERYAREVGDGTPASIVAACRRTELITVPDARMLPPREELQALYDRGIDLGEWLLSGGAGERGPASR